MNETASASARITKDDKIWAALSYVWIISIVALAARKNNGFVRFHASQGAFLFLISLASFIPLFGQLVGLIAFILAVVGIIKAYRGEKWPLPLVASAAQEVGDWLVKTLKL